MIQDLKEIHAAIPEFPESYPHEAHLKNIEAQNQVSFWRAGEMLCEIQ